MSEPTKTTGNLLSGRDYGQCPRCGLWFTGNLTTGGFVPDSHHCEPTKTPPEGVKRPDWTDPKYDQLGSIGPGAEQYRVDMEVYTTTLEQRLAEWEATVRRRMTHNLSASAISLLELVLMDMGVKP